MAELNNQVLDKKKLLLAAGVLHSARAFIGPDVLHVDLTNLCNFNCLACWCRSPLLQEKAMPEWERKLTLSFDLLKGVFDDLSSMGGLRSVKLVGGGEPFMHPDILNIVAYIKKIDKAIEIDINTNFSFVNEKTAEELIQLGVDSFTVSLWAGTPEVYAAVHPNQTQDTFHKIRRVLKYISDRKKELNRLAPRVIIHDVIFNLNYQDAEEMVKFGLAVGADAIQFVPMDPFKGKTDGLLLDQSQRRALLETLSRIDKRYDPAGLRYTDVTASMIELSDFRGFIRRLERLDTNTGAYDEKAVDEIPCYVGWLFARIMATGNVVPCCKGHRMPLGNIHKNRFRDIWFSSLYNEFRRNGLSLHKGHPYFSRIGNDAVEKTGCYNCDNLWQNIPVHAKVADIKKKSPLFVNFCHFLLKGLFPK